MRVAGSLASRHRVASDPAKEELGQLLTPGGCTHPLGAAHLVRSKSPQGTWGWGDEGGWGEHPGGVSWTPLLLCQGLVPTSALGVALLALPWAARGGTPWEDASLRPTPTLPSPCSKSVTLVTASGPAPASLPEERSSLSIMSRQSPPRSAPSPSMLQGPAIHPIPWEKLHPCIGSKAPNSPRCQAVKYPVALWGLPELPGPAGFHRAPVAPPIPPCVPSYLEETRAFLFLSSLERTHLSWPPG